MAKTTDTKTKKSDRARRLSRDRPRDLTSPRPPVRRASRALSAARTIPAGPSTVTSSSFSLKTCSQLGQSGDLVKVRPGFARNYLVPQGMATFATPNNLRMVEKHRERLKQLEEARRADLQNLAAQIGQRSLTIEANANAEGHLYGSVNADQIAEVLKREGFPIEPDHVRIEGPLKELGLYSIKVQLAADITGEVKLWVVPTHSEDGPPEWMGLPRRLPRRLAPELFHQVGDFLRAAPRQRDTRAAMPVVMDDSSARLDLQAHVPLAQRSQSYPNRLGGVDLGALRAPA